MICQTCGAESAPGKFCSNCGAELPATEYDQTASEAVEYEQPVNEDYGEQPYNPNDYEQQPIQDTGPYDESTYAGDSHEHSTDYEQTTDPVEHYEQQTFDTDDFGEQPYQADPTDDLFSEGETETAATDAADDLFASDVDTTSSDTAKADNEIVDKTKEAASNFATFFVNFLKEPAKGVSVAKDQLISSVITLAIFSFIIALNVFFIYRQIASLFGQSSFVDGFLLPFIGMIILFAVVIGVTFAGVSITHQSFSFTDTVAKFGALVVPFLTLYLLAFIVSLMDLVKVYMAVGMTSILGSIIVIPTMIILQKPSKRFDQVFVLLGVTLINLIALSTVMSSLLESIIASMFGSFMSGF